MKSEKEAWVDYIIATYPDSEIEDVLSIYHFVELAEAWVKHNVIEDILREREIFKKKLYKGYKEDYGYTKKKEKQNKLRRKYNESLSH